jgi:hypothetical protein
MHILFLPRVGLYVTKFYPECKRGVKSWHKGDSNMTSFKRFESKPVVKIILIYDRLNLWHHRQFITIFYQFLHNRIEIIHLSHMYTLFLPRVGLYVSFLPLAYTRGKTSWHKGLPVVKTIYAYGFHEGSSDHWLRNLLSYTVTSQDLSSETLLEISHLWF